MLVTKMQNSNKKALNKKALNKKAKEAMTRLYNAVMRENYIQFHRKRTSEDIVTDHPVRCRSRGQTCKCTLKPADPRQPLCNPQNITDL
ncbi:UNVERIFIED_CONTAM: hypothetical protein FKN15_041800 [Acipenser sinensis]